MIRVARPAALPPADAKLVVVEASAGTGKTFFLEHRVVDLILGGAELGQILLVTFTEKAVAELRLRIRDLLDRMARADTSTDPGDGTPCWELDEDARRRLRAAVTAFDHAPIYTIHGFCHRVLIEDAFAAQRLFDQTQVADEVAFDAAFGALLRERFARVAPDRELLLAYLEGGGTVDTLRALLLACARAGGSTRRTIETAQIHATADALRATYGSDAGRAAIAQAMPGEMKKWLGKRLDEMAAVIASYPPDGSTATQLLMIDGLREPLDVLAKYAHKLPGPSAEALRAVARTMSLEEAIATELLPQVLARIGADKAEQGQFDYDDMLRLVAEALRGPRGGELATRLRTRTPWAMIDEFQDTDPVQWEIFRTGWMHPEARGLTIVGDPKQAIYGFRGADVATYVAAREEMLRNGATRVPLTVNRRSTEPLVAAINQILVGTPGMPLLDKSIRYDDPVTASGDIVCSDPRPPVTVYQLAGKGADAIRAALAAAIGDAIEGLRAAPPAWSLRGVPQPFALGQVMVLGRSNKDSTSIAAALRERGLPCALVEPEKLFDTREAAELANVLAAIASPRDRSARLRALRTRFFDVPWAELAQTVDAPDHHPLIARLFDWAQLASRRAYEALFRRLIEDSRYAERALILGGGERALTNTWHLIELLLEEVARSRSDLHELVGRLRRWISDTASHPDERDVQRAETDADAIRVLTIHKAKGLEAPYVFLFGGTTGAPPSSVRTLQDPAGRVLVVGPLDEATQQLVGDEADGENQRLAYVALTRAQVRLYLPIYGDKVVPAPAMYHPVQRCLVPHVASHAAASRTLFEAIQLTVGGPEPEPPPADALASFTAPPQPAPRELAPLALERGGIAMLSYTRLAHDLDAAAIAARPGDALAIDPAEFDVDDSVGQVGPNDLPPGADSGLMLHDVFEEADLALARGKDLAAWAAEPSVGKQLAEAARGRGVATTYLPHAAEIIHATLTHPLALTDGQTLPPLCAATALAREVEFSYPLPGPRRGLVRGFIDALVAYDDELWVLDYKSDLLAGDDRAAAAHHRVVERYSVQARLYAIAADRMRGKRRLAGLLFAFVRDRIVVPVRLTDDSVATWTAWLAAIPRQPPQERA